jgi:hypothetical protein
MSTENANPFRCLGLAAARPSMNVSGARIRERDVGRENAHPRSAMKCPTLNQTPDVFVRNFHFEGRSLGTAGKLSIF